MSEKLDVLPEELANYDYIKYLSKGAYGAVFLLQEKETGQKVALKKARNDEYYENEIQISERLKGKNNPNVLKALFSFHDEEMMYGYIGYEYVKGGNLADGDCVALDSFEKVIKVLLKICEGLKFLHQNRIVHSDIKLQNILCSDHDTVKIADFGFSKILTLEQAENFGYVKGGSIQGTPRYMSQELLTEGRISFGNDVWALGVLIYFVNYDKYPFNGKDREKTFALIKNYDYDMINEADPVVSYERIFCEYTERMTVHEIYEQLKMSLG